MIEKKIEKYLVKESNSGIPNYKQSNAKCCSTCKFVYHDHEGVEICQNEEYETLEDWVVSQSHPHLNSLQGIYVDGMGICPKYKRGGARE